MVRRDDRSGSLSALPQGRQRTRLKICCISSIAEARTAIRHGADALGLVSAMPSGPGVIDEEDIAQIAAQIPPPLATFLLTSSRDPDEIIAQQKRCGANTLQLVDAQTVTSYARLREALPGVSIVQVIHVQGEESIREAEAVAPHVDAILLDSGNPTGEVKELGGTGRTHDWSLSREIRVRTDGPVFLAGGLRPENITDAVRQVSPFGVDVCSGVRTDGQLDEVKLQRFVRALHRGAQDSPRAE